METRSNSSDDSISIHDDSISIHESKGYLKMITYHFQSLFTRTRDYDDMKSCIDNLGIIASFLIGFAIVAVTTYNSQDWEDIRNALENCHMTSTQLLYYPYDIVLHRYKSVALSAASTGLMAVISVAIFHIYSDVKMAEIFPLRLNIFKMYLAVLIGITVYMSTWMLTFYYDIYMFAKSDICVSIPTGFGSISATVLTVSLVSSALFTIFLFAPTVSGASK